MPNRKNQLSTIVSSSVQQKSQDQPTNLQPEELHHRLIIVFFIKSVIKVGRTEEIGFTIWRCAISFKFIIIISLQRTFPEKDIPSLGSLYLLSWRYLSLGWWQFTSFRKARSMYGISYTCIYSSHFKSLHWITITQRIQYKILSLTQKSL